MPETGQADRNGMPRISIVIPTRNRARLLGGAIRTALAQSHDDVEIVVSNNACTDHTDDVVREIGDPRVRLVHSGQTLPMYMHWDFALAQARGEYVTFLCDDDALHPRALEIADSVLQRERGELAVWSAAHYVHPGTPGASGGNRLTFQRYVNHVLPISSKAALRQAFGLRTPGEAALPLMLNCLVRRSLLDVLRERMGRVYLPTSPDYSFLAGVLTTVDRYLWLDAPLMISGTAAESIGNNSANLAPSLQTFVSEVQAAGDNWVECVPLQQRSSPNSIADSLMRVQRRLPELASCSIDWPMYYEQCRRVNEHRARIGLDVSADVAELDAWVQQGGAALREQMSEAGQALLAGPPESTATPIGPRLFRESGDFTAAPCGGSSAPFDDIVSAAAWLDRGLASVAVNPEAIAREVLAAILVRNPPPRRVVLYGAGENGRYLHRQLRDSLRRRSIELVMHDDGRSDPIPGVPHIDFWNETGVDRNTFTVVTPWDSARITNRLLENGHTHGQQWISWREAAEAAADVLCAGTR